MTMCTEEEFIDDIRYVISTYLPERFVEEAMDEIYNLLKQYSIQKCKS